MPCTRVGRRDSPLGEMGKGKYSWGIHLPCRAVGTVKGESRVTWGPHGVISARTLENRMSNKGLV